MELKSQKISIAFGFGLHRTLKVIYFEILIFFFDFFIFVSTTIIHYYQLIIEFPLINSLINLSILTRFAFKMS